MRAGPGSTTAEHTRAITQNPSLLPHLPPFGDLVRGHGPADQMFMPADVAAREAGRRCRNQALRRAVERITGGVGPQPSDHRPVFMLIRAIASWDFEVLRFLDLCHTVGAEPVIITMLGDRFTSLNQTSTGGRA